MSASVYPGGSARCRREAFSKCRRHGRPNGGRVGGNRVEIGARQADDDAIADGAHRRGTWTAGKEGNLSDRRAVRDFRNRFSVAFDLDGKTTGYNDVQRVGVFALA